MKKIIESSGQGGRNSLGAISGKVDGGAPANVTIDVVSASDQNKNKIVNIVLSPGGIKRSRSGMGYNSPMPKLGSLPRMTYDKSGDRNSKL